jgi:hypothetical protein
MDAQQIAVAQARQEDKTESHLNRLVSDARTRGSVSIPVTVEEPELLAKTAHVRNGLKLMELIAEVGISIVQLREWDRARIKIFCDQARENNRRPR